MTSSSAGRSARTSRLAGEVDDERATWAAKTAHVHEDIVALPMGYGTFIGTIGSMLSGGQIQRVLLARALYRKPRIVFMDEGTAHLDLDLEGRVTDSLGRLGVTRVIVTHRPAMIAKVDQVVEIDRPAGG